MTLRSIPEFEELLAEDGEFLDQIFERIAEDPERARIRFLAVLNDEVPPSPDTSFLTIVGRDPVLLERLRTAIYGPPRP